MIVPMIVYITFYIHRVDITFILGSFKMLLIVWLCVTLSSVILKKFQVGEKMNILYLCNFDIQGYAGKNRATGQKLSALKKR